MLRYVNNSTIEFAAGAPDVYAFDGSGPGISNGQRHSAPSTDVRHFNPGFVAGFAKRIASLVKLGSQDLEELRSLCRNCKWYEADYVLVSEGIATEDLWLIVQGLAYRYKLLSNGRRQILGYLLPGDICDLDFLASNSPDYSVALSTDSQVLRLPLQKIVALRSRQSGIERSLLIGENARQVLLREWLLNICQRKALGKVGHFFCEMYHRYQAIGQISANGSFPLPIKQAELADTAGLTLVHLNRTLQRMREMSLIVLRHRRLTIVDVPRLEALSGFETKYLQCPLGQAGRVWPT